MCRMSDVSCLRGRRFVFSGSSDHRVSLDSPFFISSGGKRVFYVLPGYVKDSTEEHKTNGVLSSGFFSSSFW